MDLNTDTLQSLAVGASGGLPMILFLLNSLKSLRDSVDGFKDKLENVIERLQKVEVVLEVTQQKEIKSLQDRINRIESSIFGRG
ncbi:MAG: hypothetical protein M3Q07_17765 [Pseudobdellovibrionaceae bacterium]|nr:hypothetical protein [Pseudobdellovibrionaceae bacterium]